MFTKPKKTSTIRFESTWVDITKNPYISIFDPVLCELMYRSFVPDEGSKKPFTDPSFNPETDSSYYTLFFVSPFYKGKLPKSNKVVS